LEDLTVLGNAAAVPIIIFLTQVLKKNFNFSYKSDFVALILALVVCVGWEIYNITPEIIQELSTGLIAQFRFGIDLVVTSFATWLAASKVYDLGHGNRKKAKRVAAEKQTLEEEIEKLKNGNGNGDIDGETAESPENTDKLRDILEGR
jgi:hypothetical protein